MVVVSGGVVVVAVVVAVVVVGVDTALVVKLALQCFRSRCTLVYIKACRRDTKTADMIISYQWQ